jgi:tRNA (guanine37-N1)-methyltransferase
LPGQAGKYDGKVCKLVLIEVVSIFPGFFQGVFTESIVKRAQEKGLVEIRIHDLRAFCADRHRQVDDAPYGGGPGMVMKPEPFFRAVDTIRANTTRKGKVVLFTPRGRLLTQDKLLALCNVKHLILLCGHYEGVDERVHLHLAEEEISIGDFVLTGGEIPAMVFVDALVRLLPGVLNVSSLQEESFAHGLLEYPQYTRPREFRGMSVPEILLSGNHENIRQWRHREALARTAKFRPDLLQNNEVLDNDKAPD